MTKTFTARLQKFVPSEWPVALPYVVLSLCVFLAYINVYNNQFLFDDELIITRNEYLWQWGSFWKLFTASTTEGAHISGGFFRPIQMLLYFFAHQAAGQSPSAYHLLNIVIHGANACLIFSLGKKLKFNLWASFFAALLWAMHPIHTEAVTYMSATADGLLAFFTLLGIVMLLPHFTTRKIFLVIPIFVLGLLSKETTVMFPALAMACFFFTNEKKWDAKQYVKFWPLWLLALGFVAWRLSTTAFDGPASYERFFNMPAYNNMRAYADHFELRLYTFFATLPAYAQLLVWPVGLHMERVFNIYSQLDHPQVLAGILIVLVACSALIFNRSTLLWPLAWGIAWAAICHFPDTGLLLAVNALFLEHWMYLPTAGLFLGTAQTITNYLESKHWHNVQMVASGLCLIVAVIFGIATYMQNRVWHDPITFYNHLFQYGVTSARSHNNLALAYMEQKEYDKAIEEFHKAIDASDTYAETRHNLAVSLVSLPNKIQHLGEAIQQLNRALEIDPQFYRSYIVLSQIYAYLGDREKADANRIKAEEILNRNLH